MLKVLSVLLFFFLPLQLVAQILPKESANLSYRIIGFSFPEIAGTTEYRLEIAMGDHYREDSFKKHIVVNGKSKQNRVIAEVPCFGYPFTWRITATKQSKKIKSELHHFTTIFRAAVDTCNLRLRIIKPATRYQDAYVFVDATKTLYDMNGEPVWFFPVKRDESNKNYLLRDLKMSPFGTITFLLENEAFEVNYNGQTLWKGPDNGAVNGEDSEQYHHEFTRLSDGHYMVLGTEHVMFDHKVTSAPDSILSESQEKINEDSLLSVKEKTPFGTLIEYDGKGNVVWSWRSSKYFTASDVVNFIPDIRKKKIDVHENAFFFDENDSIIYISFKNISRIVKVKYPEGNVLNAFGEKFRPGTLPHGNGLFCDQHSCKYSEDGYLYMFNNNVCQGDSAYPTVLMLREYGHGSDSLTKAWEYQCSPEGVNYNTLMVKTMERQRLNLQKRLENQGNRETVVKVTNGGNVTELPDHSIFVAMNSQYGKLFIVSREKKVLWSAVPERYNPKKNEWYINPLQYRASLITRKDLERLIWHDK